MFEIPPIDLGGAISLGITIAIGIGLTIIYVKKKGFKGVWNIIEKDPNFPVKAVFVIPLIVVSFVALWLTIRVVGLYIIPRYLLTENYVYTAFDILEMVAYVLTIRLCLTLIRARKLSQIVNAAIQSVLIGVITSIPNIGAVGLMFFLASGSGFQFIFFMIGMAVILIVLVFVSRYVVEKEEERTESN